MRVENIMEDNTIQELSQEELEGQEIAELPTRHAMTLIDTGGGGLGGGLLGGTPTTDPSTTPGADPTTMPTDTSTVPAGGTQGAGFATGFAHTPDLSAVPQD